MLLGGPSVRGGRRGLRQTLLRCLSSGTNLAGNKKGPFSSLFSSQSDDKDGDRQRGRDLLSRIHLVRYEGESAAIVDGLLRRGRPVAVNMKDVTAAGQLPSMVQVKTDDDDDDGRIFSFLTGRNARLLEVGRLKNLLESGSVLKVMHAITGDMQLAYQAGIQLWNVCDVAMQYSMCQYQNQGRSLNRQSSIALDELCLAAGLPANKQVGTRDLAEPNDLANNALRPLDSDFPSEDLLLHAAYQVEPLLEVHRCLSKQLAPDYVRLVDELTQDALAQVLDPDLLVQRRQVRAGIMDADLFLCGLAEDVTEADLYQLLQPFEGYKNVLLSRSSGTAHVLMSNRKMAVLAQKRLSEAGAFPEKFGVALPQVQLVHALRYNEQESIVNENERHQDRLRVGSHIASHKHCAQLVSCLISAGCPVACELACPETGPATLKLFAGRNPPCVFNLDLPDILTRGGLGRLLASSRVTKVVSSVAYGHVYQLLSDCQRAGFRPANFFQVTSAYKMLDYWYSGQSVFGGMNPTLKDLVTALGLTHELQLENLLSLYWHFQRVLPSELRKFRESKDQAETLIGTAAPINVEKGKDMKNRLRRSYETRCLHVNLCGQYELQEESAGLGQMLQEQLSKLGVVFRRVIVLDAARAVVEVMQPANPQKALEQSMETHLLKAIECLNNLKDGSGRPIWEASPVRTKSLDVEMRVEPEPVDLNQVYQAFRDHAARLETTGFFDGQETQVDLSRKGQISAFGALVMDEYKTAFR